MAELPEPVRGAFDVRLDGVQRAPLTLDSPHSGSAYPQDFRPAVGPERYRRAEDMDVDVLFDAGPRLGLPMLAALFPRIWLDVNRAPDDLAPEDVHGAIHLRPSAKARLGKGVIWTAAPPGGDRLLHGPLPAGEVHRRIEWFWRPYHAALDALQAASAARFGRSWHLNLHSMQSVSTAMHEEGAGKARPEIVLSDRDGQTCAPAFIRAAAEILTGLGFVVAINDPYKGAEIVRRLGRPAEGLHALQIEVNRALYMDEATRSRNARFEDTRARLGLFLERLAARLA